MGDRNPFRLPHGVIPITDPDVIDDYQAVNALFAAGCQLLHLRKPQWSDRQLHQWCAEINPGYKRFLTLHGNQTLAAELGCGGSHGPTRTSLKRCQLRRSLSWHALDEPNNGVDYGFLSPIWPSTSKPGYGPSWSTAELSVARQAWIGQVVALGGITPERTSLAMQMGFDGVAVLGWLWTSFDGESVVKRWCELEAAWSG